MRERTTKKIMEHDVEITRHGVVTIVEVWAPVNKSQSIRIAKLEEDRDAEPALIDAVVCEAIHSWDRESEGCKAEHAELRLTEDGAYITLEIFTDITVDEMPIHVEEYGHPDHPVEDYIAIREAQKVCRRQRCGRLEVYHPDGTMRSNDNLVID